jgi:uncharacterized membrane protein YdjX (TVP38/TMEM64 family)
MSTSIVLAMRAEREQARKAREAAAKREADGEADTMPMKLELKVGSGVLGHDVPEGSVGSLGGTRNRLNSWAESVGESITESVGKLVKQVKAIPRHRIVLFFVLVAIFTAVFILFHVLPVVEYLMDANAWLKIQGARGVMVLVCATIVWICLCLPSVMVEILCAATYGFWPALAYLSIIKTTAAALVFIIGLKAGREIIHRHFFSQSPVLRAVEKALSNGGIRAIFLMQLVPLPFGMKGYMLSVSGVRFDHYMLTACMVEIPFNLASAYIGSAAGDLATTMGGDSQLDPVQIAVITCGGVGVIVSMVGLQYFVRKELRKLKKAEAQKEKEMDSDTDSDDEAARPQRGHLAQLSDEALSAHAAQEPEADWQERIAMYEQSGTLTPRSTARSTASAASGGSAGVLAAEDAAPTQPSPWAKPAPWSKPAPLRSPQAMSPDDDGNGHSDTPLDMSL